MMQILKIVFFAGFIFLSSCGQSVKTRVFLQYAKQSNVLNFEVQVKSNKPVYLDVYMDIENSLLVGVVPGAVEGRKPFILASRTGEVKTIRVSPGEPYSFLFKGIVKVDDQIVKLDFGTLGFVNLSENDVILLGVKVFPKQETVWESEDGLNSNYIELRVDELVENISFSGQ